MTRVQILDLGSGNLFSIENAIRRLSRAVEIEVSQEFLSDRVQGLVLPGVGSFSSAQRILSANREEILQDVNSNDLPLLGICLGMQIMFEQSEEGIGEGLNLFEGKVKRFPGPTGSLKIPHMGWNTFKLSSSPSNFCKGLDGEEWAYYVHSFFPEPGDAEIVKAWTEYGSQRFPAIIERGNILGTQFHPEKSQSSGARLISNFIRACEKRRGGK